MPLVILGIDGTVILIIAIIGTLMQDLNHANLAIDWGPLRYVFNSPKMHVWHHDVEVHGKGGQNFGIVLSVWDWLFGTVYWPRREEKPDKLGFRGMESFPKSVAGRLVYPFFRRP
jgi:sterol desaturase/sphingolipid hydroxylase (fatty acid hydroxylase superfamily)